MSFFSQIFNKNKNHAKPAVLEKNRLESLTDGVFAIAMTLLIIELHVPNIDQNSLNTIKLISELEKLTPNILSYFLSFAILAMFWMSHHFILQKHAKNIDRTISHINSLYLAFIAFIPFTTKLLAVYFSQPIAVALYGINIFVCSLISVILIAYIWKAKHIDVGDISDKLKTEAKLRLGVIVICSIFGIFFSFIYTPISLLFYGFAVVFNIIPGFINIVEDWLY